MKKSFLLHIDRNTSKEVPFEEVTFLASLKANMLEEISAEIYLIEITLMDTDNEQVGTIVKIGAYCGEYTGYSCGNTWESGVSKAFESIRHQIDLLANLP